jgi:hypothetical protein
MAKRQEKEQLNLNELGRSLRDLGMAGRLDSVSPDVAELLKAVHLAKSQEKGLFATTYLYRLGQTPKATTALRRVLSLVPDYRAHLLAWLLAGVRHLADDRALADTLERLDHLSAEMLPLLDAESPGGDKSERSGQEFYDEWDALVWQAPDAVTLLAKVVEDPADLPERPDGPCVVVGLDWLSWDTPPPHPAPAPWGDPPRADDPLATVRHPFWGALVSTLDAGTGDYEWQTLVLRDGTLRSRHHNLGSAEAVLQQLWGKELGLSPAAPLVVPEEIHFVPGRRLPWLERALGHLQRTGVADMASGSWRLTDNFRTQLMSNDEHMRTFEALRKRSYRLAQAAERTSDSTKRSVAS